MRDWSDLWGQLERVNLASWAEQLNRQYSDWALPHQHGTLPKWLAAYDALPNVPDAKFEVRQGRVAVDGAIGSVDHERLRQQLMEFHPWRKGPFELLGVHIDTEWRSDIKWDRLAGEFDFAGKDVLDVGCGNGYYGWRMLQEGARLVLGCDPFYLYVMQFEVLRRYARRPECHFVLPIADSVLPAKMHAFDMALSMGVLYHRTSPIDHLQTMRSTLKKDGQLVLETIVLEEGQSNVLTPQSRYAKMRNVWFLPTIELLVTWLERTGFRDVVVHSIEKTTLREQRRTDWMTFESLQDFLDPNDASKTVEGYPAPVRGLLSARVK